MPFPIGGRQEVPFLISQMTRFTTLSSRTDDGDVTKLRERGPALSMWAAVVIAIVVANVMRGVPRAVAVYGLVWWVLTLAVLGWTEEDPMLVAPGEAAIQHVGRKIFAAALIAAVLVGPPAWWLLRG